MSETVHYKGKLKKIKSLPGLSLNETAKLICKELNIEENDYWKKYYTDNYIELLCDNNHEKYITANDKLYEVLTKNSHDLEEEIIEISDNGDGTYDYEMRWYNGGAGFREVIQEGFDKLNKQ